MLKNLTISFYTYIYIPFNKGIGLNKAYYSITVYLLFTLFLVGNTISGVPPMLLDK